MYVVFLAKDLCSSAALCVAFKSRLVANFGRDTPALVCLLSQTVKLCTNSSTNVLIEQMVHSTNSNFRRLLEKMSNNTNMHFFHLNKLQF